MRIAITGATGLVGCRLVQFFEQEGHFVTRIVRQASLQKKRAGDVFWNVKAGEIDRLGLEGHDVVINLAGANIASRRWSEGYKQEILESRVQGTKLLCEALAGLQKKPGVLLSASAMGFYGNQSAETEVDEFSPKGHDFLADVCQRWEQATEAAARAGIRTVHLRFSTVLSPKGGALGKMLPIFKLGLGGKLGRGEQMFSWIALDEIPLVIQHLIKDNNIEGPVNVTSPQPLSNKEFTQILGKVIKRSTIFPVPSIGVKALFGEMGETLLLGGMKVSPKRLLESGYTFQYPDLITTLTACL